MSRFYLLILIFLTHFSFSKNLGLAPIDPEYESWMYQIYRDYHSGQLTSSEWAGIVGDNQDHSTQKRDNLWDISGSLFGNSNYWPKLWAVNPEITNPHQIGVNQIIRMNQDFYASGTSGSGFMSSGSSSFMSSNSLGDSQECGSKYPHFNSRLRTPIGVYDSEFKCSYKIQKRKIHQKENEKILLEKDIDKKIRKALADGDLTHLRRSEIVRRIPSSLPPTVFYKKSPLNIYDSDDSSVLPQNVLTNYLMDEEDINIVGSVDDIPDGPAVVTIEIIIELDVPASPGSQFTVIRPLEKISNPSFSVRGPFGHEVVLQGIVEVVESVPNQEGFYFAKIKKLYSKIDRYSQIVEEPPKYFNFETQGQLGTSEAQIVGVASHQASDTLTAHSFVYLNRGREDNVNEGDILAIKTHPAFHPQIKLRRIGELLVVHSSDSFSTAFVRNLSEQARVGDYATPFSSVTKFESDDDDDIYTEEEIISEDEEEVIGEDDEVFEEDLDEEEILEEGLDEEDLDDSELEEEFIGDEDEEEFLDEDEEIEEENIEEEPLDEEEFIGDEDEEEFLDEDEEIEEENIEEEPLDEEEFLEDEEDLIEE